MCGKHSCRNPCAPEGSAGGGTAGLGAPAGRGGAGERSAPTPLPPLAAFVPSPLKRRPEKPPATAPQAAGTPAAFRRRHRLPRVGKMAAVAEGREEGAGRGGGRRGEAGPNGRR